MERGLLGIAAVAAGTALAAAGLQQLLRQARPELSNRSSDRLIHRSGRFDPDPERRRQARLLQAAALADDPATRSRLLQGQGWGGGLLPPVVLKLQALDQQRLGHPQAARSLWRQLERRFPMAPPAADALYALGGSGSPERRLLLQRFPAHPAALAAALEWQQSLGGTLGGLHLARWGDRWPGGDQAMAAACRAGQSLTPAQRDLLAGGLAEQGDLAAARRCLGTLPPQTARTRERLAARAPAPGPAERAWERTRQLLLQRDWPAAATSLANDRSSDGSPPREARRRFWMGMTAALQGRRQEARQHWQTLLRSHPYGYYAWRASERLQMAPPALPAAAEASGLLPPALARLSGLNLAEEAWEHWRTWRGGTPASSPQDLWREGQLRLAVGDRWIGLAQLDRAALAGAARGPAEQALLEQQRHPLSYQHELQQAASATGVDRNLLTAIARQESRLTPTVHSVAGAVGLMQLLPDTARMVAPPGPFRPLEDPGWNALLGARYLRQLLQESGREPMLAVASYNAGPGAAQGWVSPDLRGLPELWAEAIPYPETRHYVKAVLGNRWTYRLLNGSRP